MRQTRLYTKIITPIPAIVIILFAFVLANTLTACSECGEARIINARTDKIMYACLLETKDGTKRLLISNRIEYQDGKSTQTGSRLDLLNVDTGASHARERIPDREIYECMPGNPGFFWCIFKRQPLRRDADTLKVVQTNADLIKAVPALNEGVLRTHIDRTGGAILVETGTGDFWIVKGDPENTRGQRVNSIDRKRFISINNRPSATSSYAGIFKVQKADNKNKFFKIEGASGNERYIDPAFLADQTGKRDLRLKATGGPVVAHRASTEEEAELIFAGLNSEGEHSWIFKDIGGKIVGSFSIDRDAIIVVEGTEKGTSYVLRIGLEGGTIRWRTEI